MKSMRAYLELTIVLVEYTVEDRVAGTRDEDEDLSDHVAVDEHVRVRLSSGLLDLQRDDLDDVIRQLADEEDDDDCGQHPGHARSPAVLGRRGARGPALDPGQLVEATHEEYVEEEDEEEWHEQTEDQLNVGPDFLIVQVRPVEPAAGRVVVRITHGPAVDQVGSAPGEAECPDDDADPDAHSDLAEPAHVVVGGQVAVDADGGQREDAGELVALAEEEGEPAGDLAEDPVRLVGGVAEEGQSEDEQLVGQAQIPDVVVSHRPGPNLRVPEDDEHD